ncbi:Thioredoxin reductase [Sanguibacter gelidistatuariae]|uniref:Thioredoxin reductase n=1 Tax=Sanguibacter gelidistatuariae TaxID=1814289 RepID=A0A1G6N506_9MICO|nr:NAD(P)/FAD-dependent oxidoreductase [Sanguibacter gelidistatuariae]SDC62900.1 Thioredoxin reductase [Sanguibacter gelidistatuariae]
MNRPSHQSQTSAPQPPGATYDVVVVGGGAAGLSAAVALGRARRSVLVIDAGQQRNLPAAGVHNFLTRDGMSPAELARVGRDEVLSYGGTVLTASVRSVTAIGGAFDVVADDGTRVRARRLLLATGLVDELPDVPGLRERWGIDVLHCPYCHGWEVRDQMIGVLASGPMAVHQALLFRQWSEHVTLFLNGRPEPTEEEAEQLAARGVAVVPGAVAGLEVRDDVLAAVLLTHGPRHAVQALVVGPTFTARTELAAALGVATTAHPMGAGTYVVTDETGLTSVPGVWAAGNVSDLMAQVVTSAARGLMVGAAINTDLMNEELRLAVEAYRGR